LLPDNLDHNKVPLQIKSLTNMLLMIKLISVVEGAAFGQLQIEIEPLLNLNCIKTARSNSSLVIQQNAAL
jgi:hypothetical protein